MIIVHPAITTIDATDLRSAIDGTSVEAPGTTRALMERLATSEDSVLICSNTGWTDDLLDHLTTGDWVTTPGSGYDQFPVRELHERGIRLTNSPCVNTQPVCEQVFGILFMESRKLPETILSNPTDPWNRGFDLTDHSRAVCCIVGLGTIGSAIAKRANAFEMAVRGVKEHPVGDYPSDVEVYPSSELRTALTGADVVILTVPLVPETRKLIGRAELSTCDDDALVINVSRGEVIDTTALIAAIEHDEISGAYLDVFEEEPIPAESELWGYDEIVLTPHTAGLSEKNAHRFRDLFTEQFERWINERPLRYRIVPEA